MSWPRNKEHVYHYSGCHIYREWSPSCWSSLCPPVQQLTTRIRYLRHIRDPCCLTDFCEFCVLPPPRLGMKYWRSWICCQWFSFQHTSPIFKITISYFLFPQADRSHEYIAVLSHTLVEQSPVLWFCHFRQIPVPNMKNSKCLVVQGVFFPSLLLQMVLYRTTGFILVA